MIKTWQQRCEEHPDHEGIVSEQMIRDRMQEEIDELRQALAEEALDRMVAENQRLGLYDEDNLQTAIEKGTKAWADVPDATKWVEELRGSDTPEVTGEVSVDNAYTKLDTTAGVLHKKWVDRLVRIMGTFDLATGHADTLDQALDSLEEELRDVLGHLRARRKWVGLTANEVYECWKSGDVVAAVEAKLKEKNT